MFNQVHEWILASASPRRKEILSFFDFNFLVQPVPIDESIVEKELPDKYLERIAKLKANSCSKPTTTKLIIAADTIVTFENEIFRKPESIDDAYKILSFLNGKVHQVKTAYFLSLHPKEKSFFRIVKTDVTFFSLKDDLLKKYAQTKEGLDKAGAYAIQGKGSFLVQEFQGSYWNIVGFPIEYFIKDLLALGWLK